MSEIYDVVVLGNASSGLALALQLKRDDPSLSVALVGPKDRSGAASLAAGAMINVYAEIGEGTFEDPDLKSRFGLVEPAMRYWDDHAAFLRETSGLAFDVQWGTYVIQNAKSTPIEMRIYDYMSKAVKDLGVEHREVNPLDIPYLRPTDGHQAYKAMWLPDGRFDPVKAIAASEVSARNLGVDIFEQRAVSLSVRERKSLIMRASDTKKVSLEDGTVLKSANLVFANGAFAQELIDLDSELKSETPRLLYGAGAALDVSIPDWVDDMGGVGKTLSGMDHVVRTTDRGGSCGNHIVPLGDGRFYSGASSAVWLEPDGRARVGGIHVNIHALINEFNLEFFYGCVSVRQNGYRPTTADCYPLLGESHLNGVWFMNGMKRDGFTSSPYLADQLSKAIRGEQHELPERFKPSRKLISYKRKDQAILATQQFYRGADSQHGNSVAPYLSDIYEDARFAPIEKVYESRDIEQFGIHPELIHLYQNDKFYQQIKHSRELV
jgi:glycine/D-amino acid oxidase-like deaminating enzyme|tara:strand:- start:1317 stop:2795 length:1479 start_codon:yes stop_codon:yes gene_type:complete